MNKSIQKQLTASQRAGQIASHTRAFKKGMEKQEDLTFLTAMYDYPIILTLTDGTQEETTPHDLTEEKLQLFLADAKGGKPYPVKAELGEITDTETIKADGVTLYTADIKEYSPIALSLANGWLDRLQDFLEGKGA